MMNWFKNNWVFLIIIMALVLFLIVNDHKSLEKERAENTIPEELFTAQSEREQLTAEKSSEVTFFFVDIKGAVNRPGVYQLSSNQRVQDAIELAGGLTTHADYNTVNLAQKVYDEMVIFVPEVGESNANSIPIIATNKDEKIRINYATLEEIASLNGIGDVKAQAIIDYRDDNGFYQSVDDLLKVNGVGSKTLEKIKESIQVP